MTDAAARLAELTVLAEQAAGCTMCRLHEGRTNVVFGSGDPDADLVIVGEGPGQREDELGLPFVGRSGELLDTLLSEIGLDRTKGVYIANVVKCRPPKNRDPKPDEIDACKSYLREQLKLVDPKVVLTLGNFSSKLILKTDIGITKLRGHIYPWWNRHLVATFHPAAALRGSARVLADMRTDLALVRGVIDGNLPESPSAPEPGVPNAATPAVPAQEPEPPAAASDSEQLDHPT